MKCNLPLKSKDNTYTRLLISLVVIFLIASFVTDRITGLLLALSFLVSNILTLETIYLNQRKLYSLRIIAGLGFLADIIYFPQNKQLSDGLSIIAYLFYTAFCCLAITGIARRIFAEQKVSRDILRGGICIYLLLGLLYFLLYRIIYLIDNNAFRNLLDNDISYQLYYFSFITLTSVGYGDITPVNRLAMTLSNTQAIIGQLYPAIFISRLVSLYNNEDEES